MFNNIPRCQASTHPVWVNLDNPKISTFGKSIFISTAPIPKDMPSEVTVDCGVAVGVGDG